MSQPSQFEVYADYNRMLRAWFVVFGVGSIAALLGSEKLVDGLREALALRCVVVLLLAGAAAQVVLAFINKTAAWLLYFGECDKAFSDSWICKVANRLSAWYWIDIFADVVTMAFFAAAIFVTLNVFAP